MYGNICSNWPRLAADDESFLLQLPTAQTLCIKLSNSLAALIEKDTLIRSTYDDITEVPAVLFGEKEVPSAEAVTVVNSNSSDMWTGVRVSRTAGKPTLSLKKVWEHKFSNVRKAISTESSCYEQDFLKHQKDESVLRNVCLDDAVTIALETSTGRLSILLIDAKTGAVRMNRELGHKDNVHLIDMTMDYNRIVLVYENIRLRRNELKLIEVFEEFKAIDRLESFKRSLVKWQRRKKSTRIQQKKKAASIRYYDQTFVVDLQDITSIALTQTFKRITPQTLLLASRLNNRVYQVPHSLFSARRPLPPAASAGKNLESSSASSIDFPVPDAAIESVTHPYDPKLPLISVAFLDGNASSLSSIPIDNLWCKPISQRESGTEIYYGDRYIDTFRPALGYDMLPNSFSKFQTSLSLIGLLVAIGWVFRSLLTAQKKLL